MCGIAGYIGTRRVPDDRADACLARMRHRGPDGRGLYRHERQGRHCLLLHTRLSILDLDERSAQPMRLGSKVLSYNGELYNYLELRSRLADNGHVFATTGDTEVLLAQWSAQGINGLDACEGMWALSVYDEADGSLVLGRDRFGEKPLYLFHADHGLYFASEIKFLAELLNSRLPPNIEQLRRFLANGYKCLFKGRETFFQGVDALPPGTLLSVDGHGQEQEQSYWKPELLLDEGMTRSQAVEGAREHLIQAVRLRLRSDVPLAFCMSGGVDSNGLIAIASRVLGHEVQGFTIVNRDERYDERVLVDAAVAELGIRHTAIPVDTADFLPNLLDLTIHHDAPVLTISYYAHWLLMRGMAEQGYKISISGTGADELFTGYYDHYLWHLAELRDEPEALARARADWRTHVAPVVRNPLLQDPDAFLNAPSRRDHIYDEAARFTGYLAEPFSEPFSEQAYLARPLRNRMLNELFHEVVPVILHEDDLNAMYWSMENRSPYLDRALFEHCNAIPARHLMTDGFNKSVLREALRGTVPDVVLDNRRKVGFNAPLFDFLDRTDPAVRTRLLEDSPIFGLVKKEIVAGLMDEQRLSNAESKFLFSFLGVKFFLEEFAA